MRFCCPNMAGDVRTSHHKSPAFVSTETAGDVLTSSQKYQTFVTLKNVWKYLIYLQDKNIAFLMPQEWLEMSRLPVKNIQHLSAQNTSGNVPTSHHNICNKSPKHVWQSFQCVFKNTRFCPPNMAGNVLTSCKIIQLLSPQTSLEVVSRSCYKHQVLLSHQKIYLFSVATNMSGNSPKVLLKTPGFVAPTRLQKSQLPVRNIQLLSRLNWLEISHHQVSFIPIHPLFYYIFKVLHYPVGVVSLQASSV